MRTPSSAPNWHQALVLAVLLREALEVGFGASRKRQAESEAAGCGRPSVRQRAMLDSVFPGLSDTSSSGTGGDEEG